MTHVTCRLTAKNRDQLRNPTLSNRVIRVWATLTYLQAKWPVVRLECHRGQAYSSTVLMTEVETQIKSLVDALDLFSCVKKYKQ